MFKENLKLSESIKIFFFLCISIVTAVELTFELPDNARECFHEEIEKGVSSTLEFQVCYIRLYLRLYKGGQLRKPFLFHL